MSMSKVTVAKGGVDSSVQLRGNPTTGFGWHVAECPACVKCDLEYTQDQCKAGMCGVGGSYTVKVTGVEVGTGKIELVYKRAWETGEPADKRTIEVTVN